MKDKNLDKRIVEMNQKNNKIFFDKLNEYTDEKTLERAL